MDKRTVSPETIHLFWQSLRDRLSISELYHENSKWWLDAWNQWPRPSQTTIDMCMHYCYKVYRHATKVTLPREWPATQLAFEEVLSKRRSVRSFSGEPITLDELAKITFYSNGVVCGSDHNGRLNVRPCPSAGALYPIELYWVIFDVVGLAVGLYHYNPLRHHLETLRTGNLLPQIQASVSPLQADLVDKAASVMILTGVFPRTLIKYGTRGYRFVLLEAGHIAQRSSVAEC